MFVLLLDLRNAACSAFKLSSPCALGESTLTEESRMVLQMCVDKEYEYTSFQYEWASNEANQRLLEPYMYTKYSVRIFRCSRPIQVLTLH